MLHGQFTALHNCNHLPLDTRQHPWHPVNNTHCFTQALLLPWPVTQYTLPIASQTTGAKAETAPAQLRVSVCLQDRVSTMEW